MDIPASRTITRQNVETAERTFLKLAHCVEDEIAAALAGNAYYLV